MPTHIQADYKKAFKPADIRGIYPTEIDEEVTYLVARSFVEEYSHKKVLVARDMRLSTPALFDAFCKGVTDAGADVVDLGMVHTPVLYYASATMKLPGVVITASHSPKNYNGLKLVLSGAVPLTETFGLRQLRRRIEKGLFTEAKRGKVMHKNVLAQYQKFVLKGVKAKTYEGMNVVADIGNGMGAVLMPLLSEKLPITFTTLFADLDGRFPNRDSDPTLKKNQRQLRATLRAGSYDFGIAFDGDADRIAFLDEQGTFINSAAIGAVIAERMLREQPKSKMVFTSLTSKIYEEKIRAAGGVPVSAKVGHAFIKETMRKKDVLFGCEHSGHYYFKEYFYTDSVTLTLRYVLDAYAEAKAAGLTFSQMMKPYARYEQTEDVIVFVPDTKAAMAATHAYLLSKHPKTVRKFDGVWVDYGDVWGSVKVSVTEPALKIMFESEKKRIAKALQDEIVAFVKKLAKG